MQRRKSIFAIVLCFLFTFVNLSDVYAYDASREKIIDTNNVAAIAVDPDKVEIDFKGDFTLMPTLDALPVQAEARPQAEKEIEFRLIDKILDTTLEMLPVNEDAALDEFEEAQLSLAAIDLVLEGFTNDPVYDYPFTAGGTANFVFYIANYGSTNAGNVSVGVYLDGAYLGAISLGTVEAYTRYFCMLELDGVSAGTHTVRLTCSGSAVQGNFQWSGSAANLPDIYVELVKVTDGEDYALDYTEFELFIYNIGKGDATNTFDINVEINGIVAASYTTPQRLPAGYHFYDEFTLVTPAYGATTVSVHADPGNRVNETTKANNRDSKSFWIKYCVHSGPSNFYGIAMPLTIQVDSNALALHPDKSLYTTASQAWNGITDRFRFSPVITYADGRNLNNDVIVTAEFFDSEHLYGETSSARDDNFNNIRIIKLSSNNPGPNVLRTLTHEFGHVAGLGDVNLDPKGCKHNYHAMMIQTGRYGASEEITEHDEYNLLVEWGVIAE